MVRIYSELLVAQDSAALALPLKTEGVKKESLPDSAKSAIFRKYNVSPREYEETIAYYNEDQKRWESFFNRTSDYLDSLKIKPVKQNLQN